MPISDLKEFVDFIPAQLHEGKTWFVSYYVKNPATQQLVRKRIKCNRITSITERRKFAKTIIVDLNTKLRQGWNPFLDKEAPKGFYLLVDAMNTFIASCERALRQDEFRPDSLRSYKSFVKRLNEWLLTKQKTDIFVINFSRSMAREFLNYMLIEKELKGRTYNNYLTFFQRLWGWLIENDYCKNNPFDSISKKAEGHKERVQYLNDDVRLRIKNHLEIKNYNFMVCCLLAYHGLIRPKEITYLKVGDIDMEKQQIHISAYFSKNKKDRYSTIPNVMVEALKHIDLNSYDKNMYLFSIGMKPGTEKLNPRRVAKYWDTLRTEIGLSMKYKFYSLRDSGIIQKIKDGIPLDEVMYQADHHSLEVTNVYAKIANPAIFTGVRDKATKF